MDKIFVHDNTLNEPEADAVIERLSFYGYTIGYGYQPDPDGEYYVVDKRHPAWRGWRDILSRFSWRHYDKECEWNRRQIVDKSVPDVYTVEDDLECAA